MNFPSCQIQKLGKNRKLENWELLANLEVESSLVFHPKYLSSLVWVIWNHKLNNYLNPTLPIPTIISHCQLIAKMCPSPLIKGILKVTLFENLTSTFGLVKLLWSSPEMTEHEPKLHCAVHLSVTGNSSKEKSSSSPWRCWCQTA